MAKRTPLCVARQPKMTASDLFRARGCVRVIAVVRMMLMASTSRVLLWMNILVSLLGFTMVRTLRAHAG